MNIQRVEQICRSHWKQLKRQLATSNFGTKSPWENGISLSKLLNNAACINSPTSCALHTSRNVHTNTESFVVSHLSNRSVLRVAGSDAPNFLQGLITNDIHLLDDGQEKDAGEIQKNAIYTMLLNNQGRILFDLMVFRTDESVYLVECQKDLTQELIKLLKRYKIRKKVDLSDVGDEYNIWAAHTAEDLSNSPVSLPLTTSPGLVTKTTDPRLATFGHRLILRPDTTGSDVLSGSSTPSSLVDYTRRRYMFGIPEGTVDLPQANSLPLEANIVFMNGVSFSKGCYIGQELTARTHHTGVIRKRLMPVTITENSSDLSAGDKIENEKGKNCGKLRSSDGPHGLALLRIPDVVGKGQLVAKNSEDEPIAKLETFIPTWWPTDSDEIIKQALATR